MSLQNILGQSLNSLTSSNIQANIPETSNLINTYTPPSFFNKLGSGISGGLSSGINFMGNNSNALKNIGGIANSFMPQTKQMDLSGGQSTAASMMDIGFKAAEMIPGVGGIFKAGNVLNSLMPDAFSGGTNTDQIINKIPFMKLANFSIGKTKDFGLLENVQ